MRQESLFYQWFSVFSLIALLCALAPLGAFYSLVQCKAVRFIALGIALDRTAVWIANF
jgi:hypothetical protein